MKKLLLALLFIVSLVSNSSAGVVIGNWYAGGSLNATDMTRGFEVNSQPSGWSETDTSSILDYYDTTQAYQGTHSVGVDVNADSVTAYLEYDIGTTKTAVSVCFWYYASTATAGNFTQLVSVFQIGAASGGAGQSTIKAYYHKSGTTYSFYIDGASSSTKITVTTGNWYRIELDLVTNSTCSISVYNSSGTQVGSTETATGNNYNMRYLQIGQCNTNASTDRRYISIDAIGIDWTDSTTPLWEYTVDN